MSLNHIWRHIWTSKSYALEKQFSFPHPRKTFLKALVSQRITIALMTNMFTCLTAVNMGKMMLGVSHLLGKKPHACCWPGAERGVGREGALMHNACSEAVVSVQKSAA